MFLPYIYTKHAIERKSRIDFIEKYSGFGEVVKEVICEQTNVVQRLTNTGVVLVLDNTKKYLITAYYCSIDRAEFFYKGRQHIPSYIIELCKLNEVYKTYPTYPAD